MSKEKIKILYFNNEEEDYLADGLLIGMLNNPEVEVWQYPVKEILYKKNKDRYNVRGKGFTLYFLLDDHSINIGNPDIELRTNNTYDLIIFSSIQRQYKIFKKLLPQLRHKNVWILDGEDSPALYPFHGFYWRRPTLWFLPRAHTRYLYFKREWTPDTIKYLNYKLIPDSLIKYFPIPDNLKMISFSIPLEKISQLGMIKTKLFQKHIVDKEIAAKVEGSVAEYAFESEEDYYNDLRQSRYGITTKRGGWDCLRHYEIAANGAVICFRDLDKKPATCAPHGLIDGVNCICYSSFQELQVKISRIDDMEYAKLRDACLIWAMNNTSENSTKKLLIDHF